MPTIEERPKPWPHPALGPLPDQPMSCYICTRHTAGQFWHSDGGREAYVEHCEQWHDGDLS